MVCDERGDGTDKTSLSRWGIVTDILAGQGQSSTDSAGPRNSTQSWALALGFGLGLESSHHQQSGCLLPWAEPCPLGGLEGEGDCLALSSPLWIHLKAYPPTVTGEPDCGIRTWLCSGAALLLGFGQNVPNLLGCGEGGWSVTGNLKNVFEDKTSCSGFLLQTSAKHLQALISLFIPEQL